MSAPSTRMVLVNLEDDVVEAFVDSVARNNLYLSSKWLRASDASHQLQGLTAAEYRAIVTAGKIQAVLPIYIVGDEPFAKDAPEHLPEHLNHVKVGIRSGYWNTLGLPNDAPVDHPGVELLRGVLLDKSLRKLPICFPHLDTDALAILDGLIEGQEQIRWISCRDARLAVAFSDFQSYLASLNSHRRRSIRSDIEKFRKSAFTVEQHQLGDCIDVIAPLSAELEKKYNSTVTSEDERAEFALQAHYLNDQSIVFLAMSGEEPVGFSISYRKDDALFVRAGGFDYSRTVGSAAYFSLGYYYPIRLAIDEGVSEIYFAGGSEEAKVLRGAVLNLRTTVVVWPI